MTRSAKCTSISRLRVKRSHLLTEITLSLTLLNVHDILHVRAHILSRGTCLCPRPRSGGCDAFFSFCRCNISSVVAFYIRLLRGYVSDVPTRDLSCFDLLCFYLLWGIACCTFKTAQSILISLRSLTELFRLLLHRLQLANSLRIQRVGRSTSKIAPRCRGLIGLGIKSKIPSLVKIRIRGSKARIFSSILNRSGVRGRLCLLFVVVRVGLVTLVISVEAIQNIFFLAGELLPRLLLGCQIIAARFLRVTPSDFFRRLRFFRCCGTAISKLARVPLRFIIQTHNAAMRRCFRRLLKLRL